MIGTNAEAASIQQAMISPKGLQVQAIGLFTLFIAAKIFRADTSHF